MLVNLSWLREIVPFTANTQELCSALTQRGFEVECILKPLEYLKTIIVGEVLACTKHPSADSLSVCTVSLGTEQYTIVCGASNVRAGIRVPVATEGTTMPNGLVINKVNLRGVDSCGMICSESELGITSESNGIWILPHDAPVGMSIANYFVVDDTVLELSITPNRGDCLSILGIAREVALYYSLPLHLPSTVIPPSAQYKESIAIAVDENCSSLYSLQCIRNIEPCISPAKMRFRLLSVGIRPLSFLVDITNYVLMELGQPLHAFDAEHIANASLTVEMVQEEKTCTTLDGVIRTLQKGDIRIADEEKTLAIAGVMGCASSEITEQTRTIALESAVFSSIAVRTTAKRLGISSEASYRFERGVDPSMVDIARNRAIKLILDNTTAEVSSVISKAENEIVHPSILFRPDKARTLLGIPIDDVLIKGMLKALNCSVEDKDFFWKITPPTYRLDIKQEADIIEEIARIYGMDTIPTVLPSIHYNALLHVTEGEYIRNKRTKNIFASLGLTETISYSFISKNLTALMGETINPIALQNPLSEEYSLLRTSLLPSLLAVMQKNYNKGAVSLSLFEIAKTFISSPYIVPIPIKENDTLAILLSGYKYPQEWGYPKDMWEYRDAKGILCQYISMITALKPSFILEEHTLLAPCVRILLKGEPIGILGRVLPAIAKEYDARYPVWCAEISLESLYKYSATEPKACTPLPSYPSISRDITFITDIQCGVGTILDTISSTALPCLEHLCCIDVYNNDTTQEKHITVRILLRDATKTLTDKEADNTRDALIQHVKNELHVRI